MAKREYLGVLDDVIERYHSLPYGTDEFIAAVIAETILYGSPGLLNDGYLVQHSVLRGHIERRDAGFLNLLERDWLTIASAIRPPSASIERRAAVGVASHRALIESNDWPALANVIDDLPGTKTIAGASWPSRDLTDGFLTLAKRLNGIVTSGSVSSIDGLPQLAKISEFLDTFVETLGHHHEAPRTQWEKLAIKTWADDDASFLAMMDLANLIYHLNISMLFGADDNASFTLTTRDSPLLAPLLGVERTDEVFTLKQNSFVASPNLTPERIAAVLDSETLLAFRDDAGRVPHDAATLDEYIDAILDLETASDLLVPPISSANILSDSDDALLRVNHFNASRNVGHVRLTIPEAFCEQHAATARKFR